MDAFDEQQGGLPRGEDMGNSQTPFSLDSLIERDKQHKREKRLTRREASTVRDYIELVREDPQTAQNAHSRFLEILNHYGVTDVPERERWMNIPTEYNLFREVLFGVQKPVYEIAQYIKAGAQGLSTGKRILLLVGPTATGKSTFADILMHALENYDLKPVFALEGCPMQESPLHVLPRHMRSEISRELGVRIDGDLCPVCRNRLSAEFENTEEDGTKIVRWWDFPVTLFTFSINAGRGIGSFEPSDPKSQDIAELVGRENIQVTSTKGYEDPRAFSLNGELEKGNRGMVEGRELIKADEKLLWIFISVAEERQLKVQGSSFPHLYVDTLVLGHTNLEEYKKFSSNKANEALHDRIYVVQFPYALRVKDEVRIYEKLIKHESDFQRFNNVHIAPGALELAAVFAIRTRMRDDSELGVDPMLKIRAYNGDRILTDFKESEKRPIDLRELLEEGQSHNLEISQREGMFGVSSRDVLDALNTAIVEQGAGGCLTPLTTIRALRNVFEHRMGYTQEELARFREFLSSEEAGGIFNEYKSFVLKLVTKAYLRSYEDLARNLFKSYIEEVKFYLSRKRKYLVADGTDIPRDLHTGKPREPNIKLMSSIEQYRGISGSEADVFRGEILQAMGIMSDFNYETYEPLRDAVEKKLLADARTHLTLVLDTTQPHDEESRQRADDLITGLNDIGCCSVCRKEFLQQAAQFVSG